MSIHTPAVFDFHGSTVRTLMIEGEPWFVARDVAMTLGYAKPENAVSAHCKAAVTTPKQGGGFHNIIPERDVYRLIFRSKLPAAEAFEDWVVGEVLPAIRKTGRYVPRQVDGVHGALRAAVDATSPLDQARLLLAMESPEFVPMIARLASPPRITAPPKSLSDKIVAKIPRYPQRTRLLRTCKTSSAKFDVAMGELIESGRVDVRMEATAGRPRTVYRLTV